MCRGRPRHRDQPVLSAHVITHLLFLPRPSIENSIQSTNLFRLGSMYVKYVSICRVYDYTYFIYYSNDILVIY